MTGASLFPGLNAAYDGRLCEILREWQAEEPRPSLEDMQERIAADNGYAPGRETLRRWLSDGRECADG